MEAEISVIQGTLRVNWKIPGASGEDGQETKSVDVGDELWERMRIYLCLESTLFAALCSKGPGKVKKKKVQTNTHTHTRM